MDTIPISQQLQKFMDATGIHGRAIAEIIGVSPKMVYMVAEDKYPAEPTKIEYFLTNGIGNSLMVISERLKELPTENYRVVPDLVAIRRINLHKLRVILMSNKKETRKSTTSRASRIN